MFCINCGKQIPDMSSFCQYCGSQVMAAPQQAPQPAPQQVVPQPQMQVPQQQAPMQQMYAAQPPMQQMYAAQPPMQQVPQQAVMQPQMQVPLQAGQISLSPVSITLTSPKNAAKERVKIDSAKMWYVEITNNQLVFSSKGNAASFMFGALGALATAALDSLTPEYYLDADKIRNMEFGKRLGGQLLNVELQSGKLLAIVAKQDVMDTIVTWWRMNTQR